MHKKIFAVNICLDLLDWVGAMNESSWSEVRPTRSSLLARFNRSFNAKLVENLNDGFEG